MNSITTEDLLIAYRKVKVDCFYETGHLTAYSFAVYEQNLINNLNELLLKINESDFNWFKSVDFIGTHHFSLKKVEFKYSLHELDCEKKESPFIFFSDSKRKWEGKNDSSPVIDFRILGIHSVNFHILSSLWIEKVGTYLEQYVSENSYGCRIKRIGQLGSQFIPDDIENQPPHNTRKILGHFRSYLTDYQSWQYNGIDEIQKKLVENKKILAVTADLKKYYHRIDCSFIETKEFIEYIKLPGYSPEQKKLNKLISISISAWSKNVYKDENVPLDFKFNGHAGVPMGLGASKVIANLLLTHLDRQIESEIKPVYYGRYVDDIFIVIEDGGTINSAEEFWHFMQKRIDNLAKSVGRDKNDKQHSGEYISEGYILGIPYSLKSLVEFGEGKEKYFFLEGSSGETFLNTLRESMDENSSEWKLPPNSDSDIESYSDQVAKANSNLNEAANGIRKSDGVSIQRLKFILYLTRFEKSVELLPKDKWEGALKKFFLLISDYLITSENLAVYSKYYARIISLTIKAEKYETAIEIISQIKFAFEKLKNLLMRTEQSENSNEELIYCLDKSLEYQLNLLYEGIYTIINPNKDLSGNVKNSLTLLLKKLNPDALDTTDEAISKSIKLFNSDLHRIPFKEAFLNLDTTNKFAISNHNLHWLEDLFLDTKELPNYNIFKEFSDWIHRKIFLKEELIGFIPYAFYFYTRPFTLLELSILNPAWYKDENQFKGFCNLFNIEWFDPKFPSIEKFKTNDSIKAIELKSPEPDLNRVFAFTSLETKNDSWVALVREDGFDPDVNREQRILDLVKGIIVCKGKKIDYVLFPELSIPRRMLLYIASLFLRSKISMIAGVEYNIISTAKTSVPSGFNGFVSNQLMYILCLKNKSSFQHISIIQEKIIPAQKEETELFKIGGKILQASNRIKYLINHGGFWFSGLICNDLLDINNRASLRGLIDALIVIEWNKDTETYDSLVASSSNDLHSFILQINNRLYGDTRLRGPYKEPYDRDKVRVRGGELDYFVVATLEVEKLREFQRNHRSPDKPFKPVPTGFEMSKARRKILKK